MFIVESAALKDQGRQRKYNQDFVTFFEPTDWHQLEVSGRIYILADGVGGSSNGDMASRYASENVLCNYFENPQIDIEKRLTYCIQTVGNNIYNYALDSNDGHRMATTIVVAVLIENQLIVANVGDSRAYLIRDNQVIQLTNDHSVVDEMIRRGELTPEDAKVSSIKNKITRSVGGEINVKVDIFNNIKIQAGDKILLCSDGLTSYASERDILNISSKGTPKQIVNKFIDYANSCGGGDNISTVFIEVKNYISKDQFIDYINKKKHIEYQQKFSVKDIFTKEKNNFLILSSLFLTIVSILLLIVFTGKLKSFFIQDVTPIPTFTENMQKFDQLNDTLETSLIFPTIPTIPTSTLFDNIDKKEVDVKKTVLIPEYSNLAINSFEVTNSRFLEFLNDEKINNSNNQYFNLDAAQIIYDEEVWLLNNDDLQYFPVVFVTWTGAKSFCEWDNGRLPTKNEWESAKNELIGETDETVFRVKNNINYASLGEVTEFANNDDKVWNMIGNVWEWLNQSDELGNKMIVGLSFEEEYDSFSDKTHFYDETNSYHNLGFRCVYEIK